MYLDKGVWREEGMQRNTIRENIEIFIVTKNSTFRYQLLLWSTESEESDVTDWTILNRITT